MSDLLTTTAREATREALEAVAGRSPTAARLLAGFSRSSLEVSLRAMPHLADQCLFTLPPEWARPEDRWPVVPAAALLEHLADAAREAAPGRHVVEIRQARFRRWLPAVPPKRVGVVVEPDAGRTVKVSLIGHASALVETAASWPGAIEPMIIDPGAERAPVHDPYDGHILYQGPRYQGIREVCAVGDIHVRAKLVVLDAPGAVLDAGMQLISYWLRGRHPERAQAVPVAVERVRFTGPAPQPGRMLDVTAVIRDLTGTHLLADVQFIADGRVWATADGIGLRRIGDETRPRAEPEGFVVVSGGTADPMSRVLTAYRVLGHRDGQRYENLPPRLREPWLLARLAAKEALRLRQVEEGAHDVHCLEIALEDGPDGLPVPADRPGSRLVACDLAVATAGRTAVALAQPLDRAGHPGIGPAQPLDRAGRPGIGPAQPFDEAGRPGIGLVQHGVHDEGAVRHALGDTELGLFNRLAGATGRPAWFARFLAAKQAVAVAERTGGAPRRCVVRDADAVSLHVRVPENGREYRVGVRELDGGCVVAWTWGPYA